MRRIVTTISVLLFGGSAVAGAQTTSSTVNPATILPAGTYRLVGLDSTPGLPAPYEASNGAQSVIVAGAIELGADRTARVRVNLARRQNGVLDREVEHLMSGHLGAATHPAPRPPTFFFSRTDPPRTWILRTRPDTIELPDAGHWLLFVRETPGNGGKAP